MSQTSLKAVDSKPPKAQRAREIHPESLLNIPLVQQLLMDRSCRIQTRAVDSGWHQAHSIPISVEGFNPTTSTIFVAEKSSLSSWLGDPYSSGRWYNQKDRLVQRLMFATHDYLHVWSYLMINELMPELEFGTAEITDDNFEDFAFCHLLTEAVATVGVDYWFLSTTDINSICDVGTDVKSLTANYREADHAEYERWNANFEVQSPAFLENLAEFYCKGGAFFGVFVRGLERNPKTFNWLNHEMSYGETQRAYIRQWLLHLAHRPLQNPPRQINAPVACDKPWQKNLTAELAQNLWRKVKEDEIQSPSFRFDPAATWKAPSEKGADFRFTNINRATEEELFSVAQGANSDTNFAHLFYQYVSTFEHELFDRELIKLFPFLLQKKDFGLVKHLFRGQKRLQASPAEPRDLFILN
jgi:hypothetical protein